MKTPTILTIAGSDSSGGAGIQADLKAIAANGGYGASVITAVTAQNTRGVAAAEPVSPAILRAQLEAVFDDLRVEAVKSGMLGDAGTIGIVAESLRRHAPAHFVCDPVMISKSGFRLLEPEAIAALRGELLPLAGLVTPNVHEAEALADMRIETVDQAAEAGRRILETGARAVLVKGGHLREAPATDVLVTGSGTRIFPGELLPARHTHGTGCTLSAAIATYLAKGSAAEGSVAEGSVAGSSAASGAGTSGLPGHPAASPLAGLELAIARAKEFVTEAIRAGLDIGSGTGPTNPFFFLESGDAAARWVRKLGRV